MIGVIHITKPHYAEASVYTTDDQEFVITGYQNIGKCFHLDKVEVEEINGEYKVSKVIESRNKQVAGELQIMSKYKFGFNRKKMPIYRFVPLDWKYPDFMVASSMKGENKYILVQLMNWTSKFPNGQIKKVYQEFDYEMLIYKWDLSFRKQLPDLPNRDLVIKNHMDYRDLEVFSIDPEGSLDVDDALSIQKIDNSWKIGIHIADVSHYFNEFNIKQMASIYLPNRVINMIPDVYANEICSLREGKDSFAFTVWVTVNNKGKIMDYQAEKTLIHNRKQYSYHEADQKFINSDLFKVSQMIGKQRFQINVTDCHHMVEVYMLLCNHLVALMLKDDEQMIYRTHELNKIEMKNVPNELKDVVKILNSKSAVYTLEKGEHQSLDLDYYTHFTSPIRRYVDIYIHQLLAKKIYQEEIEMDIDLDVINDFNQRVKKLERDIHKREFIQMILDKGVLKLKAHVLKIEERHLTLYFDKDKIIYRFRVFDKLLDNMINVNIDDDSVKYINKHNGKEIEIKLYQEMDVSIVSKYDNRNIKIDIMKDFV
jgi:exoribonuclease R